jgi:hypothetical protein
MVIGVSPQGEECVLVALGNGLVPLRRFVRTQLGDCLDKRQTDDPSNGFGFRLVQALRTEGKAHGGDDVMLTIDQGSIDIENGEVLKNSHGHPVFLVGAV